ncbi:MAG: hypothetical protein WBO23_15930 [Burkholderiales bacterium]
MSAVAFEEVVTDFAARGLVRGDEFLLHRRQHVVVGHALHDEERDERDVRAALEDFFTIRLAPIASARACAEGAESNTRTMCAVQGSFKHGIAVPGDTPGFSGELSVKENPLG